MTLQGISFLILMRDSRLYVRQGPATVIAELAAAVELLLGTTVADLEVLGMSIKWRSSNGVTAGSGSKLQGYGSGSVA